MDHKKPPLGTTPHFVHNAKRIRELTDAISRNIDYVSASKRGQPYQEGMEMLLEWVEELESIVRFEKNHPGKWIGGTEDD